MASLSPEHPEPNVFPFDGCPLSDTPIGLTRLFKDDKDFHIISANSTMHYKGHSDMIRSYDTYAGGFRQSSETTVLSKPDFLRQYALNRASVQTALPLHPAHILVP